MICNLNILNSLPVVSYIDFWIEHLNIIKLWPLTFNTSLSNSDLWLEASTSITDLWIEQLESLFERQVQLPRVFHLELLEQLDSSLLVLYVCLHECPTKTVVQVAGFVGILEPSEILKLLLLKLLDSCSDISSFH